MLLFAGIADAAGCRSIEIPLKPGMTVEDLAADLAGRYPRLKALLPMARWAVNQEFAGPGRVLAPGDEVAVIPPVSGGSGEGVVTAPALTYRVQDTPLSLDELVRQVSHRDAGGIVVFMGTVREHTAGRRTLYLEYEAYPSMAEKEMARIGREAAERWPGVRVAIAHRVGHLDIGDIAVIVAASAPHRPDAFAAARFAIDSVKATAPIWKKEVWDDGKADWVHCEVCTAHAHGHVPEHSHHHEDARHDHGDALAGDGKA